MRINKKISAIIGALCIGATIAAAPQTVKADTATVTAKASIDTVSVEKDGTFDVTFTYTTPAGSDVRALKAILSYPTSKLEVVTTEESDMNATQGFWTNNTYSAYTMGEGMTDSGSIMITFKALADCTVEADEVFMSMEVAIDNANNRASDTARTTVSFAHADSAKVTDQKDATCITDGYTKVTCQTCEKVLSNTVIPADGQHHWVSTGIKKEATCKEEGLEGFKCDRDAACTATKEEKIAKTTAHKWIVDKDTDKDGWKVTAAATTTAKGSKERKCEVCGDVEKAEIPMLTPSKPDTTPGKDNGSGKTDGTTKTDNKTTNTGKTTTGKGNTTTNSAVKTGDDTMVMVWGAVLAVAAAFGGVVVYKKRSLSK